MQLPATPALLLAFFAVVSLMLLANIGALQSSVQRQRLVHLTPEQISRAARLDDPINTREAWLRHNSSNTSTLDALQQKVHSSSNTSTLDAHWMQHYHQEGQLPANIPAVLCSDTCFKAHDGICDEGRGGNLTLPSPAASLVVCDLGTDCSDCGPWQGVQHSTAWTEVVGPVQYVRMHGHAGLRLQQVPYQPAFLFAHADPARDSEQSARMSSIGVIEPGLSQVFHAALDGHCNGSDPAVVVDVGANFGWYSLMAAALGCRAVAIEPVPLFRAFLEFSAARNHLTHQIEVLPAVVAADTDTVHVLTVPLFGQLGTAGLHSEVHQHPQVMKVPAWAVQLDDLAFPAGSSSSTNSTVQAQQQQQQRRRRLQQSSRLATDSPAASLVSKAPGSVPGSPQPGSSSSTDVGASRLQQRPRLSSRFLSGGARVQVMKVDVEGHEPEVLATARRLLSSGDVQHILMEYSPGYFYTRLNEMPTLPTMLLDLLERRYRLMHLPWHVVYDDALIRAAGAWNASRLPDMDVITRDLLAYDVWTAEQLKNGSLPGMHGPSSWPCPEMAASGMSIAEPQLHHMALHVLFHPLSFGAHFVFNTNVWASLRGQLQPPGRDPATDREGFPAWYDPAGQWFPLYAGTSSEEQQHVGLPWATCAEIPPAHQVAHRCRCRDWHVCGEHQVAVQMCLRKHITGYENLLERGRAVSVARLGMAGQT